MSDRDQIDAYLVRSPRVERQFVEFIAQLKAISRGEGGPRWPALSAAERVAAEGQAAKARETLRRVLQARQLVRRMQHHPVPPTPW
jgi:hypothetical protein